MFIQTLRVYGLLVLAVCITIFGNVAFATFDPLCPIRLQFGTENGGIFPLNSLTREEKAAVQNLVNTLAEEKDGNGTPYIFALGAGAFRILLSQDSRTSFSHVYKNDKGEIRGFVLAKKMGNQRVHVEKLGVVADIRNRGVGKTLLSFVAARAQELGLSEIDLLVLSSNRGALNFYQNLGFSDFSAQEPPLTLYPSVHLIASPNSILSVTSK